MLSKFTDSRTLNCFLRQRLVVHSLHRDFPRLSWRFPRQGRKDSRPSCRWFRHRHSQPARKVQDRMLKLNSTRIFMHVRQTERDTKTGDNVRKGATVRVNVDKKVLVGWKKNYNWRDVSDDGTVVNVRWRTSAHKGSVPKPLCTEPLWSPGLNPTDKHGKPETNCHCKPLHNPRFQQGV